MCTLVKTFFAALVTDISNAPSHQSEVSCLTLSSYSTTNILPVTMHWIEFSKALSCSYIAFPFVWLILVSLVTSRITLIVLLLIFVESTYTCTYTYTCKAHTHTCTYTWLYTHMHIHTNDAGCPSVCCEYHWDKESVLGWGGQNRGR